MSLKMPYSLKAISTLISLLLLVASCSPNHKITYKNSSNSYVFFPRQEEPTIALNCTETHRAKGAAVGLAGGTLLGPFSCLGTIGPITFFPPILATCAGIGAVTGTVMGAHDAKKTTYQADVPQGMIKQIQSLTLQNEIVTEALKKSSKSPSGKVSFTIDPDKWSTSFREENANYSFVEIGPNSIVFSGGKDLYGKFTLSITTQTKAWLSGYEKETPHIKNFDCTSDKHTLVEWGDNDYSHLKNDIKKCLDDLSLQIAKYYIDSPTIIADQSSKSFNTQDIENREPVITEDMSRILPSSLGNIKVKYPASLLSDPCWECEEIREIDKLTELEAIKETKNWVFVKTQAGDEGWISRVWIQD